MFCPTHMLVSRSRRTPVQLVANGQGFHLLSEVEAQQNREPAFEIRPKLGIYCKGIPVVGYRLEPLAVAVPRSSSETASTEATLHQP